MSDDLAPSGQDTPTPNSPQGGEQQAPSYDDRLNERFAELQAQIPDLIGQSMTQWHEANQPAADDEDDGYDLEPGDEGYDEQALQQYLQDQIDQGIQKNLAPMQEAQLLERRNDAWEKLSNTLPDLKDPELAAPYVQEAVNLVDNDPAWVNSPRFVGLIEKVYKAAKADERAAQETPADGRSTPLESQGGAAPEGDEEELQDRIMKLAQASKF